jgi:hypothetical protein
MQQAYKPDSVSFPENRVTDFCHLSNQPTPRLQTGHLIASVYMAFQPRRQTALVVSNKAGGLLHHLFTLISSRVNLDGTVVFCSALIPSQVSFFQEAWHPLLPGLSSHQGGRQKGLLHYLNFRYYSRKTAVAPYPYSRKEAS